MRWMLLLAGCLCATSCAVFSGRDKEAAELHLKIGTSQLQNGYYPQALASLLQAERLDPENPQIQNNLGLAYFVREKYELAEKHIRLAIELSPSYSDARNNLARVLIEQGKYSEGLAEAQKVLADLTYAQPEKALFHAGLAQFRLKHLNEALESFRKSIDQQRESCLANSYFGRTYYELKKLVQAAEALDRAVGFCQKDQYDEPHYYSGLVYYELGQRQKSEARLEELLKVYPNGKYRDQARALLKEMRR